MIWEAVLGAGFGGWLHGAVVGYAGVIGGSTAAAVPFKGGDAITPADGQAKALMTATQFGIASVSKFLTGLAAVQLLDGPAQGSPGSNVLGANLDTPIYEGGLPKDWKIRKDAQHITYRDVLTHRSGIAPSGSTGEPGQDYFSLKK